MNQTPENSMETANDTEPEDSKSLDMEAFGEIPPERVLEAFINSRNKKLGKVLVELISNDRYIPSSMTERCQIQDLAENDLRKVFDVDTLILILSPEYLTSNGDLREVAELIKNRKEAAQ